MLGCPPDSLCVSLVQFADRVRGLLRGEHHERDRGRAEVRLIAMLGCPPDTLRVAILGKIKRRLKCARCGAKEPQLVVLPPV